MINFKNYPKESIMLSWLRFPLALLIVFIHTGFSNNPDHPVFYIGKFLSEGISVVAVPTFFFISGYLFFAKYENFGLKEYQLAMRKKFVTLAIPYFLWIAFVYYGYGLYSGQTSQFSLYPSSLYKVFWAESDGFIATSIFGYKFSILSSPSGMGVLWFVRDLMVAMLLSPVIWWIVCRCKMWSILVFLLPYLLFIAVPIKGFGLAALCFFPIGATFSICGKNISYYLESFGMWILIIFSTLFIGKYIFDINQIHYHRILGQFVILSGIGAVMYISYYSLRFEKASKWICLLGESSFFIYVGHAIPVFYMLSPIIDRLSNSLWSEVLAYFFSWSIRIIIIVCVYFVMKKVCPKILSVLVGGRIKASIK